MAIPKSWSAGVVTARRRKIFALSDANRTLPLVRRVVADVVRTHEDATVLHAKLEHRTGPQRSDVEKELERTVDRLHALVDELREIGCELKDYRMGLVDFLATHHGREINLCWRLGEESIQHWHELHDGFSARQPVSLLS
ncbi:MAG TPA: DUF2203 domain-containing protein [Tepidisphaeraceae bacterium]|jgi:hypothetical protein